MHALSESPALSASNHALHPNRAAVRVLEKEILDGAASLTSITSNGVNSVTIATTENVKILISTTDQAAAARLMEGCQAASLVLSQRQYGKAARLVVKMRHAVEGIAPVGTVTTTLQ
jgi:hypothetical protein